MLKAQEEFVDQMTRKLLVDWCCQALAKGGDDVLLVGIDPSVYRDHALAKKWISGSGPYKVLSLGYDVATRYLK